MSRALLLSGRLTFTLTGNPEVKFPIADDPGARKGVDKLVDWYCSELRLTFNWARSTALICMQCVA
jgi:hypothetical protein